MHSFERPTLKCKHNFFNVYVTTCTYKKGDKYVRKFAKKNIPTSMFDWKANREFDNWAINMLNKHESIKKVTCGVCSLNESKYEIKGIAFCK